MSTIRAYHMGPRALAALFVLLVVALFGEVGTVVWVYEQGQTEHQICQAFGFVGTSTENSIAANVRIIKQDMATGNKTDATTRRKLVSEATSLLIRVNRVQC